MYSLQQGRNMVKDEDEVGWKSSDEPIFAGGTDERTNRRIFFFILLVPGPNLKTTNGNQVVKLVLKSLGSKFTVVKFTT